MILNPKHSPAPASERKWTSSQLKPGHTDKSLPVYHICVKLSVPHSWQETKLLLSFLYFIFQQFSASVCGNLKEWQTHFGFVLQTPSAKVLLTYHNCLKRFGKDSDPAGAGWAWASDALSNWPDKPAVLDGCILSNLQELLHRAYWNHKFWLSGVFVSIGTWFCIWILLDELSCFPNPKDAMITN